VKISSRDVWLTVSEIASWYRKSPSSIRLQLRDALRKKFGDVSTTSVDLVYQKGAGQVGHRYHVDFIKQVFGSKPDQQLSEALTAIFNKRTKLPVVGVVGAEPDEPLIGMLGSRMRANEVYNALVAEMIRSGRGLRIRCITGTDFFNAHRPTGDAFFERKKVGLDVAKVLLVYPFGHGAEVRSAAEGDRELEKSQLSRDARSTFEFIRSHVEMNKLELKVKWVDDLPLSLLIWTEDYALVEPYDHGRQDKERSGCIGRKAPIMVVKSGTAYHTILKNGFDYIFDGQSEETQIQTYFLKQIDEKYSSGHPLKAKLRSQPRKFSRRSDQGSNTGRK